MNFSTPLRGAARTSLAFILALFVCIAGASCTRDKLPPLAPPQSLEPWQKTFGTPSSAIGIEKLPDGGYLALLDNASVAGSYILVWLDEQGRETDRLVFDGSRFGLASSEFGIEAFAVTGDRRLVFVGLATSDNHTIVGELTESGQFNCYQDYIATYNPAEPYAAVASVWIHGQKVGSAGAAFFGIDGTGDGWFLSVEDCEPVHTRWIHNPLWYVGGVRADGDGFLVFGSIMCSDLRVCATAPFCERFNSSGVSQWSTEVSLSEIRGSYSAGAAAPDGSYFMAGSAESFAIISHLESDGELLWTEVFLRTDTTYAKEITILSDGDAIVAGSEVRSDMGTNVWVARFDAETGTEKWRVILGDPETVTVRSMIRTDEDNVILIGQISDSDCFLGERVYVAQITGEGEASWCK